MTQTELRESYEKLTEVEKELYFELVENGCDRDYILDLLQRMDEGCRVRLK